MIGGLGGGVKKGMEMDRLRKTRGGTDGQTPDSPGRGYMEMETGDGYMNKASTGGQNLEIKGEKIPNRKLPKGRQKNRNL